MMDSLADGEVNFYKYRICKVIFSLHFNVIIVKLILTFSLTIAKSTSFFFFFNATATPEIYTLSLHDALPISPTRSRAEVGRPITVEAEVRTTTALPPA